VAVWNQYGEHTQVIGPARVRLWWSTLHFLEHHIAGAEEYLKIDNRDGTVKHVRGPTTLFENPVYHRAVSVQKAVSIPDASSHIVVRRKVSDSAGEQSPHAGVVTAERTIVSGPTTFWPEPTDTLHVFDWTDKGAGALSKTQYVLSIKSPIVRALKFTVRDANDHEAEIRIDLRTRMMGISEAMTVTDPVATCDLLLQTRVQESLAGVSFAVQGTSLLIAVQTPIHEVSFTQKLSEALRNQAACELISATVRDVKPSAGLEKLQRKEDDLANAKMGEQLAAMALDAAMARQEQEQKLAAVRQAHELSLGAERAQAAKKQEAIQDQRKLANLQELNKLGVDLTRYLCNSDVSDDHRDNREVTEKLSAPLDDTRASCGRSWLKF